MPIEGSAAPRVLPSGLYWLVVVALFLFGLLAIFSIGLPFAFLGLTLAVLAPFRRRPRIFWPALVGVAGFIVATILVAPLGCVTTVVPAGSGIPGRTMCSNLLGLPYSGVGDYNPQLWLAPVAGAVLGGVTTLVVLRLMRRRTSRR